MAAAAAVLSPRKARPGPFMAVLAQKAYFYPIDPASPWGDDAERCPRRIYPDDAAACRFTCARLAIILDARDVAYLDLGGGRYAVVRSDYASCALPVNAGFKRHHRWTVRGSVVVLREHALPAGVACADADDA